MTATQASRGLSGRVRGKVSALARRVRLWRDLRRISGPARFALGPGDVVVVALVRDGMYYLDDFLRHYRAIGARHFVFVDTGSSDGTRARLAGEPGCAVLAASLPWGEYENDFRRIAAQRFAAGHWCLFADMDEILDVPDLGALTARLTAQGASALVAQMVEMFPDAPLGSVAHLPYSEVLARFDHCDLGHVTRFDYHDPAIGFHWYLAQNRAAPGTSVLFGGMRNRVFGENCCLTKHPLVFIGPGVWPSPHPHCSAHVTCADFTVALRHYKFANDPLARDARSVAEAAIAHGEDKLRLAALQRGDLSLMGPDARRYTGPQMLYDQGFLIGAAP